MQRKSRGKLPSLERELRVWSSACLAFLPPVYLHFPLDSLWVPLGNLRTQADNHKTGGFLIFLAELQCYDYHIILQLFSNQIHKHAKEFFPPVWGLRLTEEKHYDSVVRTWTSEPEELWLKSQSWVLLVLWHWEMCSVPVRRRWEMQNKCPPCGIQGKSQKIIYWKAHTIFEMERRTQLGSCFINKETKSNWRKQFLSHRNDFLPLVVKPSFSNDLPKLGMLRQVYLEEDLRRPPASLLTLLYDLKQSPQRIGTPLH